MIQEAVPLGGILADKVYWLESLHIFCLEHAIVHDQLLLWNCV